MTGQRFAPTVVWLRKTNPRLWTTAALAGGVLGCCIPIVGLVLFLVWKDTKPKTAKAAGIGALVSVGIGILYYILMFAIGIGMGIA